MGYLNVYLWLHAMLAAVKKTVGYEICMAIDGKPMNVLRSEITWLLWGTQAMANCDTLFRGPETFYPQARKAFAARKNWQIFKRFIPISGDGITAPSPGSYAYGLNLFSQTLSQ